MNNYTGQLKGFPQEIIDKMCDYQVEQGNSKNPMVFDNNIRALANHGGFNWNYVIGEEILWRQVLLGRDFNLFFQKYPKKSEYPKLMYVSDISKEHALTSNTPRVVFMEKRGRYLAWSGVKTIEESEKVTSTNAWSFAVDMPIEQPQ